MATIQPFDPTADLQAALLWQYEAATGLRAVVAGEQAWFDANQSAFWTDWYRDVFDLRTANDFGLSVWAFILDLPLLAYAPASGDREVFGFDPFGLNFYGDSNFGRDNDAALELSTAQRRLALRLRYFQLTTRGAVPEINAFLAYLFGDEGDVYVLDGGNMTATYVFTFSPSAALLYVLENFDLLPRPAGVAINILINPADRFGFAPYYLNFDNSNFAGGDV